MKCWKEFTSFCFSETAYSGYFHELKTPLTILKGDWKCVKKNAFSKEVWGDFDEQSEKLTKSADDQKFITWSFESRNQLTSTARMNVYDTQWGYSNSAIRRNHFDLSPSETLFVDRMNSDPEVFLIFWIMRSNIHREMPVMILWVRKPFCSPYIHTKESPKERVYACERATVFDKSPHSRAVTTQYPQIDCGTP